MQFRNIRIKNKGANQRELGSEIEAPRPVGGPWIRSDTGAIRPLECSHPRKPSKPRGARTLLRYGHLKMGLMTGYGLTRIHKGRDPPRKPPRNFLEIFQQVLMRRDPLNTIARHNSGWPRIRSHRASPPWTERISVASGSASGHLPPATISHCHRRGSPLQHNRSANPSGDARLPPSALEQSHASRKEREACSRTRDGNPTIFNNLAPFWIQESLNRAISPLAPICGSLTGPFSPISRDRVRIVYQFRDTFTTC